MEGTGEGMEPLRSSEECGTPPLPPTPAPPPPAETDGVKLSDAYGLKDGAKEVAFAFNMPDELIDPS